jgi:Chromosome segregation ATPases
MTMTVSVRIAHLHAGKAKSQRYHDARAPKQIPGYVDKAMTHLNSVLLKPKPESMLRDECERLRAQREPKRRMKADAAIVTAGIITFGHDAQTVINGLEPEVQDVLFMKTAEAIADRWNTDIVSLVVHRDESAPHAHFSLLAVDRTGKPLSKTIDTRELQDIAGQVFLPYDITRGTPKAVRVARGDDVSKIVHRSVRQLHNDLPRELANVKSEIEKNASIAQDYESKLSDLLLEMQRLEESKKRALQEQEDAQKKADKNQRLILEQQVKLDAGRVDAEKAQSRIEIYERRAADAENRVQILTSDLQDLDRRHAEATQSVQELEAEKNRLQALLKTIQSDIPDVETPEPQSVNVVVSNKLGLITVVEPRRFYTEDDVKKIIEMYHVRDRHIAKKSTTILNEKLHEVENRDKRLNDREHFLTNIEDALQMREENVARHEKQTRPLVNSLYTWIDGRSSDVKDFVQQLSENPVQEASVILRTGQVEKYGVQVQIRPKLVLVPAGQSKTDKQIAAALYNVTKQQAADEAWPGIVFTVTSEEIAKKLHEMSAEDALDTSIMIRGQDGAMIEYVPVVQFAGREEAPVHPVQRSRGHGIEI